MVNAEDLLKTELGESGFQLESFRGQKRFIVPAERIYSILQVLKDKGGFNFLSDITAVDYLHYPNATDRYGVIYVLTNLETGEQIVVKTYVNDPDPKLPSVYALWRGADWMEREVFDMYGVIFEGHPDFRRILLPEGFASYPLRKDYPLRGRGERHNFPIVTRAES